MKLVILAAEASAKPRAVLWVALGSLKTLAAVERLATHCALASYRVPVVPGAERGIASTSTVTDEARLFDQ